MFKRILAALGEFLIHYFGDGTTERTYTMIRSLVQACAANLELLEKSCKRLEENRRLLEILLSLAERRLFQTLVASRAGSNQADHQSQDGSSQPVQSLRTNASSLLDSEMSFDPVLARCQSADNIARSQKQALDDADGLLPDAKTE